MAVNDYRDLQVRQKRMDIVVRCYRLTSTFPREEIYGLSSQLRRAAVAIPAKIAEGHGRNLTKPYKNHLSIAMGSLKELETHILIAQNLEYVTEKQISKLLEDCTEIGKMISGLTHSHSKRLTEGEDDP